MATYYPQNQPEESQCVPERPPRSSFVPDDKVREFWRAVNGPRAEINGPVLAFAAVIAAYVGARYEQQPPISATAAEAALTFKEQRDELLVALKRAKLLARPWIDGAIKRALRNHVPRLTFREWEEIVDQIDAAIAKAEGQ